MNAMWMPDSPILRLWWLKRLSGGGGKTIGGLPVLINNAHYNNSNGLIDAGVIDDPDFAILGPFDTVNSNKKTCTIKSAPAPTGMNYAFLRVYNDLAAKSGSCYSVTVAGESRTVAITGRFLVVSVKKSEAANFFIHDDTNDRYVCKGSNVQ